MKQERMLLTGQLCGSLCELACLLFNRRARQAVHGLVVLRRAHEHVLVMAALEGCGKIAGPTTRGIWTHWKFWVRGLCGWQEPFDKNQCKENVYGR